jgi:hypothetical protein
LGFWLCLRKKEISALIVISFLPYVRSEGLFICGVYGLCLLWEKKYFALPWLLTGSLAYGLAGLAIYGNPLWVFTEIPYLHLSSVYGKGSLFHFVKEMYYVVGFPVYTFFLIGLILPLVPKFWETVGNKNILLIWLSFLSIFVAHSLFWYLGIFNSMGLKRVLICALPQICLIGLYGFNNMIDRIPQKFRLAVSVFAIGYLLLFPIMPNPAALRLPNDLDLDAEEQLAQPVLKVIRENAGVYPLVYNHHYLSMALDIDHFDVQKHQELNASVIDLLPAGTLIIWETVCMRVKSGVSEAILDKDKRLEKIYSNSGMAYGSEMRWAVYRKI